MITERRKIEYVTSVVGNSGGLGIMFFGLVLTMLAVLGYVSDLSAQRRNHYGKDLTLSLMFSILVLLFWIFAVPRIRGYLREKYGQVQKENGGWSEGFKNLLYFAPLFLAQFVGIWADVRLDLPLSVTVLLVAVFVFGLWFANQRGVSNFLLYLAGIVLILSFAPWEKIYALVTVLDDEASKSSFYHFVCSLIFGIVYTLLGLFDYRLMIATLKPIAVSEEEIYESV